MKNENFKKKDYGLFVSLLLVLTLLPLISAIQIDSGTIFNSEGLSTTFTTTDDATSDLIIVESTFIFFQNLLIESGNRNYDCGNINITDTNSAFIEIDILDQCTLTDVVGGGLPSPSVTTTNDTQDNITEGDVIMLFQLEEFHTQWFIGETNIISIRTEDIDGNLIDVDNFEVKVIEDIRHNIELSRSNTGKYKAEILIHNKSITDINLIISVNQSEKGIIKEVHINLVEKTTRGAVAGFFETKFNQFGDWITDNKFKAIILAVSIIALILLLTIISSLNKD